MLTSSCSNQTIVDPFVKMLLASEQRTCVKALSYEHIRSQEIIWRERVIVDSPIDHHISL